MKLQQIKLSGFKSFVDNTIITVNGDLVGIVGPNGCGKSNVIDAVRWVLGESSAKQLRGESMQDVIFNGSTSRKAVSRATVELVFDNSIRALTGLWNNYNEISIKRLLTRQGESIYYINNQAVRRKDITELFLGTGLGSKGYAVIEQGMISRIIEAKPEDLRIYLEEASGVSKYREKRKETILRLQDTRDNLIRIADIQNELSKQIESLESQATTAIEYQTLQAEIKDKQLLQQLLKISKAEKALAEIKLKITNYTSELDNSQDNLTVIEEQLNAKQDEKNTEEVQLEKLTTEFNTVRTNLARVEERVRHKAELVERLTRDKHDAAEQLSDMQTHLFELTELVTETDEDIATNLILLEEKQLTKEDKTIAFDSLYEKYTQAMGVVEQFDKQINLLQHELDLLKNTLTHKKNQWNSLITRSKRLEQETADNTLDFNQSYFALEDEINTLDSKLEFLSITINKNKTDILALEHKKTHQFNLFNQCRNDIASKTSKITTIEELLAKQNGQVLEMQSLVLEHESLEVLWNKIQVANGYELAVTAVLGSLLNALHIDNLDRLKEIPPQKLALWFGQSQEILPVHGSLSDFVEITDKKLSGLYTILNQFQVQDHADKNLTNAVPKVNIVTLTGQIITPDYALFNEFSEQNHILEYKNQLTLLHEELAINQVQFIEFENSYLDIQNALLSLQQVTINLESEYQAHLAKSHQLKLDFTKQEQIYIQTTNHQKRVTEELAVLNSEIEYISDELTELEIKIHEQEVVIENLDQKQQQAKLQVVEQETAYNLAKAGLQDIDNQVNQAIIENQLLNQKLLNYKKMIADKEQQIMQLEQKITSLEQEHSEFVIEDQNQELASLQIEIAKLAGAMENQNIKIKEVNLAIATIKNTLITIQHNKQSYYEKLNQVKLNAQEQELLIKNHNENLVTLGYDNFESENLLKGNQLTLEELHNQVVLLQGKIEALGLVNLKAIEDLSIAKDKYEDMQSQVTDLEDAISSLEAAIMQIDDETRRLLDETYLKVNQAFAIYFKTLFGGGGANLELSETDILSAGLHIFAQPPGKKNSSIHLLSGGEKALTAMSLIFAFFNLNPAPFCLLDEVDAPLDDANTARFCNLVRELACKTQFVYISHNRLTMEMADQLIGVTMQEKGVSTVVSVSLIDAIKHAG